MEGRCQPVRLLYIYMHALLLCFGASECSFRTDIAHDVRSNVRVCQLAMLWCCQKKRRRQAIQDNKAIAVLYGSKNTVWLASRKKKWLTKGLQRRRAKKMVLEQSNVSIEGELWSAEISPDDDTKVYQPKHCLQRVPLPLPLALSLYLSISSVRSSPSPTPRP